MAHPSTEQNPLAPCFWQSPDLLKAMVRHFGALQTPYAPCFVHNMSLIERDLQLGMQHGGLVYFTELCFPHSPFEKAAVAHPSTGQNPRAPCLAQSPELLAAMVRHVGALQTPCAPCFLHNMSFYMDLQPGMQHGWLVPPPCV